MSHIVPLFGYMKGLYGRYKAITILWLGSTLLVYAAAIIGRGFIIHNNYVPTNFGYTSWFSNWDGQWYNRIAEKGYFIVDAPGLGPQAFYPLYPLLGSILHKISGVNIEYSMLAVSLAASFGFALVWKRYLESKCAGDVSIVMLGSAIVLLWPASYFLRVSYTESLYLLLLAIFFLGMLKRAPVLWLVFICGLLTATRPNGIICSVVLGIHCLLRESAWPYRHKIMLAAMATLASMWGLGLYMLYLGITTGNPFLSFEQQYIWRGWSIIQDDPISRLAQLISLRPAWGFLFNGDLGNTATYPFILQNKLLFLFACLALPIGAFKKWITKEELSFCLLTLVMVYYSNAQLWFGMVSIGRYCMALLPVFYVYARLLAHSSKEVQCLIISACAAFLSFHVGFFAQMYGLY